MKLTGPFILFVLNFVITMIFMTEFDLYWNDVNFFKEFYDSEERELDDLCAFYAEQDFKFGDNSSSSSAPSSPAGHHQDDDEESKKNKTVCCSQTSRFFIC